VCAVWSERNGKNGKVIDTQGFAFSVFYSVFRSVFRSVCGCDRWRVLCGAGAVVVQVLSKVDKQRLGAGLGAVRVQW